MTSKAGLWYNPKQQKDLRQDKGFVGHASHNALFKYKACKCGTGQGKVNLGDLSLGMEEKEGKGEG